MYRIVKYCRLCKKRFLVNKGEDRIRYCADCQKKVDAELEKETEEDISTE